MRNATRQVGVFLLTLMFVFGTGVLFGAPRSESLKVRPGTLSGAVCDSTGKSISGISLCLVSGDKVIAQAETDREGKYVLSNIAAGRYSLLVPGMPAMRVIASQDAETSTLKIVLPQTAGYASPKRTEWVLIGLGGGAMAAVGGAVTANNVGGGGGGGTVSP